jgi:hypothetical protein
VRPAQLLVAQPRRVVALAGALSARALAGGGTKQPAGARAAARAGRLLQRGLQRAGAGAGRRVEGAGLAVGVVAAAAPGVVRAPRVVVACGGGGGGEKGAEHAGMSRRGEGGQARALLG